MSSKMLSVAGYLLTAICIIRATSLVGSDVLRTNVQTTQVLFRFWIDAGEWAGVGYISNFNSIPARTFAKKTWVGALQSLSIFLTILPGTNECVVGFFKVELCSQQWFVLESKHLVVHPIDDIEFRSCHESFHISIV